MPIEKLISGRRTRTHLKQRRVRLGLLDDACEECGISEWRGRPLSLCLHHVNGVNDDYRWLIWGVSVNGAVMLRWDVGDMSLMEASRPRFVI